MNELHYQIDLLKAMNQKLSEKERMYQRVSESAEGAYLYCSLEKNQIVTLGQWNDFFSFAVKETRDFEKLLEAVDENVRESFAISCIWKRQGKRPEAWSVS